MVGSGPGGIKIVRRKLADGTIKEYRYNRRRRITRPEPDARAFLTLADEYYKSPEFARLSPAWQAATFKYVALLDKEIRWMTLADLQDREARTDFYEIRDALAATPSKADKAITVLRRVLGWAYGRNKIRYNHAVGIERLVPATHSRAEKIWPQAAQDAFLAHAKFDLSEAFRFSLLTLIRESDMCRVLWENYDGKWLTYRPSKTGRSTGAVIHLPVFALPPLEELVEGLNRKTPHMLTQYSGKYLTPRPWAPSTLSRRFELARAAAGLAGADLRWHDLRGTGITRLYLAGCTDAEVASISGHVMGDRAQQRSYIARARELAVHAFGKLSAYLWPRPPRRTTGQMAGRKTRRHLENSNKIRRIRCRPCTNSY